MDRTVPWYMYRLTSLSGQGEHILSQANNTFINELQATSHGSDGRCTPFPFEEKRSLNKFLMYRYRLPSLSITIKSSFIYSSIHLLLYVCILGNNQIAIAHKFDQCRRHPLTTQCHCDVSG